MSKLYKPGIFLRLPLPDGSFGYGRALEPPHDAFYEYRTESPDSKLDRIASKPILFRIAVRHKERSAWEAIGWREMDERLAQPVVHFKQELGDFRQCIVFDDDHEEMNGTEEGLRKDAALQEAVRQVVEDLQRADPSNEGQPAESI